ncbi:putative Heat shock protein 70kD domain superfamily [Septoria linicola]|nr:putative Heat shock protein 70kD domain superfamily [Septoria linicola]
MASRSPSRERPYHDSTPNSPLSPLSPSGLPQWLRPSRTRAAMLSKSRMKVLLIGIGCVLMGWTLTSALGPPDYDDFMDLEQAYSAAPNAVLSDPTEIGTQPKTPNMPAGVIGAALPEDDVHFGEAKKPSVSGALAELHSAIKDKLHSLKPYRRPGHLRLAEDIYNKTAVTPPNVADNVTILPGEHVLDGLSDEEKLGARTRIGKCTILFYGNSAWERAIRTHERHDREHGYRLHVLRQQILDDVWSKPAYILSLLLRELAKPESERLEWLLWVDADTVLLNPHIPIDVFLPPPGGEFDDIHLVYSNDWNGLNNGVFPVRVNQWAVQLFSAIVSFRHYRPNDPLTFRDQSAMDILLHEPAFAPHIVQAPQRWFNAYQGEHNETLAPFQLRRGDFLVHFAGVGNREERMIHWLNRAEQHLDDWEVPLKSTSYPQEARDFWSEQSSFRRAKSEAAASQRLKIQDLLTKVQQRLTDYGDRLGPDHKDAIEKQTTDLQTLLTDPSRSTDIDLMTQQAQRLEEVAQPLITAVASAQKLLLNAAHEAIFAGEKDLLEGGFSSDSSSDQDLQSISSRVQTLKDLVMVPQDQWNRNDIISATSALTEARALWKTKVDGIEAERKKAEEERMKKAKEFIELQAQIQAEAGNVVPEGAYEVGQTGSPTGKEGASDTVLAAESATGA